MREESERGRGRGRGRSVWQGWGAQGRDQGTGSGRPGGERWAHTQAHMHAASPGRFAHSSQVSGSISVVAGDTDRWAFEIWTCWHVDKRGRQRESERMRERERVCQDAGERRISAGIGSWWQRWPLC